MTKKKWGLWFSRKQRDEAEEKTFGELKDGRIVEYTEAILSGKNPDSRWDDYVFLGEGDYHHSEPIEEAVKH